MLTVLYLLFSEGYFSKSNNNIIRKDLCAEAIRLALILTENPLTNKGKTNALLALMCFQSSRLDARVNELEEAVLFEDQDRNLWNQELIDRGNYFLIKACSGNETSKYHLEASIAYWHTNQSDAQKWNNILQLYNQLILVEYSPIAALNRTYALYKAMGHEEAILEAEQLKLENNQFYHTLLGELYQNADKIKAVSHFNIAISLSNSEPDKHILQAKIDKII